MEYNRYIAIVLNTHGEIKLSSGGIKNNKTGIPKRAVYIYLYNENILDPTYEERKLIYNANLIREELILKDFYIYNSNKYLDELNDFYFANNNDHSDLKRNYPDIIKDEPIIDDNLNPGDVVYLIDGGFHTALILRVDVYKSYLLMITSNDLWNKKSRKITKDEFNLLGIPQRKQSYFAPVLRSNNDLSKSGVKYPEYRIKELIEEFK